MHRQYAESLFWSRWVQDDVDGYSGLELMRASAGKDVCVARVVFWDSIGQFCAETIDTDVPLAILEELIAEAKATVKTR